MTELYPFLAVRDVNGDGLNDVVTSLSGHGFGLAWFEQKRDAGGKISFVEHMISDDYSAKNAGGVAFSEQHGSTFADVDGDGLVDGDVVGAGAERTRVGSGTDWDGEGATGDLVGDGPEVG